jgi:pilus assembly protein CpaC
MWSQLKAIKILAGALLAALLLPAFAQAKTLDQEAGGLYIPYSRSVLVLADDDISEVLIADPDVADVHVIGSKHIAFIGKKLGRTNAKLFNKENKVIREFDVLVGYDLPGIRKALHTFLPHEHVAVELVNTNIALTGNISDASVADEALRIVNQFVSQPSAGAGGGGAATGGSTSGGSTGATAQSGGGGGNNQPATTVLNLMKINSGQQVMLRVRIGEVQRNAIKNLGVELAALGGSRSAGISAGSQGGGQSFQVGANPGFPGLTVANTALSSGGIVSGFFTHGEGGLSAALTALETEGVLRMLAEPNLVAISGEKAEFLAGGEFPVNTVQVGSSSTAPITTTTFQPFGVAVQFVPLVLSDNRIRLTVQPEVSQIDQGLASAGGTPGLDTRRAKTTVELAPGESFMIAGLIQDSVNAQVNQVPGASEIPILGSLLRSTTFNRNETELVIAVTPYIVDPLKGSDVRLPSDDFRPASLMEQFFYGALGSMSGNAYRLSQTPSLEGPIGFMTD